jgi:hypothetical protein
MQRTSSKREKPSNSSKTALPATNHYERPATAGSHTQSIEGTAVNSPAPNHNTQTNSHTHSHTHSHTPSTSTSTGGGVRDSVMKRFSLLKSVGRKTSRLAMGDFGGTSNGVLNEPVREE